MRKESEDALPKLPAEDETRDLKIDNWNETAGSEQSQTSSEGLALNLIDGDPSKIWHSVWSGTDMSNIWINIYLLEAALIDGLRYQLRSNGGNGTITGYIIEVSLDNGETYYEVTNGSWSGNSEWKLATFKEEVITDIRLKVTSARSDSAGKNFGSRTEIRLTGLANKSELEVLIRDAEVLSAENYIEESWQVLQSALAGTKEVVAKADASQKEVDNASKALIRAYLGLRLKPNKDLLSGLINKANRLNRANYTPKTFNALTSVLDEVKAVLENPEADEAQIKAVSSALTKALEGLEIVKPGDTTISIKPGDNALIEIFAGLSILSAAGISLYRKKED